MKEDELEHLEFRLKAILPEEYQDCDDVQPVSMGSAGLKYGGDGKVAWDQMWGSFCDLAMAGGPPHKGTLLEPGSAADIAANYEQFSEVVEEICRGIRMISDLPASASTVPGWICVGCEGQAMAEWLVRAITMENISVRCEGMVLHLPAGPNYRLTKEIKNVITAFAKTSHYWRDHMRPAKHREIGQVFSRMAAKLPFVEPALSGHGSASYGFERDACRHNLAEAVHQATGLLPTAHRYSGWLGFECSDIRTAIWMMRALVASNVLSRREGTTLFVPVNPASDPAGGHVAQLLIRVHHFAALRS